MNTPERRRVFVWRLGGWLVSVAVGYRMRDDVRSIALSVSWAQMRVEA